MRILYEGGYFTCYFVWCNSFCLSAWLCKAMSYYSKINKSWLVENIKGMILDNDYFDVINNIPKESNHYHNTMDDYALIDNNLSRSQTDIGESSNIAQIAQTYECNFDDSKFSDYVCILSVLAQAAIDNAKRRFDVDISDEIKCIKKNMDIKTHKYPSFWEIIKKRFNKNNINKSLVCPMNFLYNIRFS